MDNIHQTSSNSHSKEAWQTIAEGLETNADYHLLDSPETNPDPIVGKILYFFGLFSTMVNIVSEIIIINLIQTSLGIF